eukprot:6486138-Amphidinium_carterae.9
MVKPPPTKRAEALLNTAWHCGKKAFPDDEEELLAKLVADMSQDIVRTPWTMTAGLPTFTTSSELWLFKRGTPLFSKEKLHLLGFSRATDVKNLSDNDIKSLAAEAMALPSVASSIVAVFLSVEFPRMF